MPLLLPGQVQSTRTILDVLVPLIQLDCFFAGVFVPILLNYKLICLKLLYRSITTWVLDTLRKPKYEDFTRALVWADSHTCAQIRHVKECSLVTVRSGYQFCLKEVYYLVQVTRKLPATTLLLNLCLWVARQSLIPGSPGRLDKFELPQTYPDVRFVFLSYSRHRLLDDPYASSLCLPQFRLDPHRRSDFL